MFVIFIITCLKCCYNSSKLNFVAAIVAQLAGQLYRPIKSQQGHFSTQMSVSGAASSTGKSLFQTVGQHMFYGEEQPSTTSITEATMYDMLEEGNIFGKKAHNKSLAKIKLPRFLRGHQSTILFFYFPGQNLVK